MKEKILRLHAEGKSYRQIEKELGCSRSTISYHCSKGQKEKTLKRTAKRRAERSVFEKKVDNFKYANKKVTNGVRDFKRRNRGRLNSRPKNNSFTYEDVLNKFGPNPVCYLTGRPIDWEDPASYCFDHFIPVSKGGQNTLENLRLTCPEANRAKGDMSLGELELLCSDILHWRGKLI